MRPARPTLRAALRRQSGIALFTALIFLLVLTILGVAALNSNTQQTRMAAGSAQNNFAFQAAETAVRAGEAWIDTQASIPLASCTAASGCPDTSAIWPRYGLASPVVTLDDLANAGGWFGSNGRLFSSTATLMDPNSPSTDLGTDQPRYVIEYLGPDPTGSLVLSSAPTYRIYYFQISGRGVSALSNVNTVTQSVYAKGY